jgi:hypothetical protein
MKAEDAPIRDEYDFSTAVRNPYAARANMRPEPAGRAVVIEAELFEKFPSSEAVNEALRSLLRRQEQDAA